jgi:ATP-dependent protease ClpP protease subunit
MSVNVNLQRLEMLAERGRTIARRGQQAPEQRGPREPGGWRITAAAKGRTRVRVYGYIGDSWFDDEATSAAKFVRELDGIGGDGIDLHLNSGGGSVFDAVAMHAALLNHPSDVVSYVDGIAASAASFLAMAGDEIVIEKPAKMMIHNARGIVLGSKADMREMADVLDDIDATIAQIYADRSGRSAAEFAAAMDAETWYSSAQAVDAGLADRVNNDKQADAGDGEDEDEQTEAAPEDRRSQMIRARARVALKG